MTRAEDVGVNLVIAQRPQILYEDGWATRLNVSLHDVTTGMIDQDVEEFSQSVNVGSLLAYHTAAAAQTPATLNVWQALTKHRCNTKPLPNMRLQPTRLPWRFSERLI